METAAKLGMRGGNLSTELWVALGQTFSNNVINKVVAVSECMAGLFAANAGRGTSLVNRHGADQHINLLRAKGGIISFINLRQWGGFNAADGGGLDIEVAVTRAGNQGGSDITS
jgi:hypothetical protein